jgi:nucleoid DNA-binding protein/cell division septation protein DedD
MDIVKYIIQILKEQEQVIIPGLGSFVAEYKSAKIHPVDHTFSPPVKQVVFDNFTPDDDFLIRIISESENVSLDKAILEVRNFTDSIITEIHTYKTATIKGLGSFILKNDNTIKFESIVDDISDESFGLEEFKSPAVVRNDFKERAALEIKKAKEIDESIKQRNKNYLIIGISTVIVILFIVLVFFTDIFRNLVNDKEIKMERPNQRTIVEKQPVIEPVTDSIVDDKLIDTVVKVDEIPKTEIVNEKPKSEPVKVKVKETVNYYLVAGSFKIQENAEKRVAELKTKGYNTAGFLQPNSKGLYVVYYDSYKNKASAETAHQKVMKEENPESWVMKNK